MRSTVTTGLLAAPLAGVVAAVALVVPGTAAAPTVDLQPQALPRGTDIAVPHIEDGVLVDGERRTELPGDDARLVGRSGDALLVATWRTNAVGERRGGALRRVEPDDTRRTLLRGYDATAAQLSEDGSRVLTVTDNRRRATVTVRSALDGSEVASRVFDGYPTVTTADERRVVVQTSRRAVRWRVGPDRVRTLAHGIAGAASLEHDLLATYTKDPYLGGCTRLVRLSDLDATVWRSCKERVAAISPDGTQMLTFHILTDGVGPGEITLRTIRGKRLATWTTGWFSGWQWESPRTVLLEVNGRRQASTVRCTVAQCENATDPVKVTPP